MEALCGCVFSLAGQSQRSESGRPSGRMNGLGGGQRPRAAGPPERVRVVGGGGAMSPEGGDVAKVTLCVGQSREVKRLGVESWALE